MRADRLLSTLLVLQARGRVTAAELAHELEVSERTARRDLEALAMAGVPVYSQAGRGGGWSLVGGARTDLTGLNADEARALFVLAGPAAGATPQVKTALRKLLRALPEPFRAGAEAAATRVVVDRTTWDGGAPAPTPKHLEALQQAVLDGVQVLLRYTDRDGRASDRVVHPLGLVAKGQVWYLVAGTDAGQRTFRVSRVRDVTATGDVAVRPEGFDLDEAWQAVLADLDDRRLPFAATLRADAETMELLRFVLGARIDVDGDRAVVRGQSPEIVAAALAGFGNRIDVVGPPKVRSELARIGAELTARYV